MAVEFDTRWPQPLTNAAWQKKKSFLDKAKSATKTGLGAELLKAEAAWKKINFKALGVLTAPGNLGNPPRYKTPDDYDHAKAVAENHLKTVAAAASKTILATAAKAAATKKNTALSTSAKTAAADIETGLLEQSRLIRDLELDDFDKRKEVKLQEAQLVAKQFWTILKNALSKADVFIKKVKAEPTPVVFNTGIMKASRDLTQNLANVGNLAAMGAGLGKPDPKAQLAALVGWAQDRDKLPGKATKEDVLKALQKYERAVTEIKHWAA